MEKILLKYEDLEKYIYLGEREDFYKKNRIDAGKSSLAIRFMERKYGVIDDLSLYNEEYNNIINSVEVKVIEKK